MFKNRKKSGNIRILNINNGLDDEEENISIVKLKKNQKSQIDFNPELKMKPQNNLVSFEEDVFF